MKKFLISLFLCVLVKYSYAVEITEGEYKVGKEIPAGEYIVRFDPNGSRQSEKLCIVKIRDNKDDIDFFSVPNSLNFKKYVTIHEGEYLYLEGCKAVSDDDQIQTTNTESEKIETDGQENLDKNLQTISSESTVKTQNGMNGNKKIDNTSIGYDETWNETEKKYKMKLCKRNALYYLTFNEKVPEDCMIYIGVTGLKMLQQIPEGTLAITAHDIGTGGYAVVLITQNSTDQSIQDDMYDNGYIQEGYFNGDGLFRYTTLRGLNKNIIKLKRMSVVNNDKR